MQIKQQEWGLRAPGFPEGEGEGREGLEGEKQIPGGTLTVWTQAPEAWPKIFLSLLLFPPKGVRTPIMG